MFFKREVSNCSTIGCKCSNKFFIEEEKSLVGDNFFWLKSVAVGGLFLL